MDGNVRVEDFHYALNIVTGGGGDESGQNLPTAEAIKENMRSLSTSKSSATTYSYDGTLRYPEFIAGIADGRLFAPGTMFAKLSVENLAALERHLDNEPTAQMDDATTDMHEKLLTAAGRFGRLATPKKALNIRGDDMFHLGGDAQRKFFNLYRYVDLPSRALIESYWPSSRATGPHLP